jgi:hypothetical protein
VPLIREVAFFVLGITGVIFEAPAECRRDG